MNVEQVLVINLDRRPDRLESFLEMWEERGPASLKPRKVSASDGQDPAVFGQKPSWMKMGRGGWGCYLSQRACLREASESGKTTLILEDDAFLVPEFAERLSVVTNVLPETVGWAYIGGQHIKTGQRLPIPLVESLNFRWLKPYNVNRMHAYIVTPEAARWTLDTLDAEIVRTEDSELGDVSTTWQRVPKNHIDHRMGWIQQAAYKNPSAVPFGFAALDPWIVHQAESFSDIRRADLSHREWAGVNRWTIDPKTGEQTTNKPKKRSKPAGQKVTRVNHAVVSRRLEKRANAAANNGHRDFETQANRFSSRSTRLVTWKKPR